MFSYSPDRYMVAVLRLIKEAQCTERDKAEGNKSKPRVGRCVPACVPGEIFICLWTCVFFTGELKFGLITRRDVEGELAFSPRAGSMCPTIAPYIWELSCSKSALLFLNSQGAGNHDKNPCSAQFLWAISPWLINELGLMGAGAVFWFPGAPRRILAAPWAPLELAGRCGWTRSDPSSAGTEATCSLQWPPSLPTNTKFIAGLRGKKVSTWVSFQNREKQ